MSENIKKVDKPNSSPGIVALALVLLLSAGCETVVPSLARIAVAFGQDLLSAASVNYAPRYAVEVENLLSAVASTVTGMEVKPQLETHGYQAPPPKYLKKLREQQAQADGVDIPFQQDEYEEPYQEYADYVDDEYNDAETLTEGIIDENQTVDSYKDDYSQNDEVQESHTDYDYGGEDYVQQTYDPPSNPNPAPTAAYAELVSETGAGQYPAGDLALDVALLALFADAPEAVAIDNGAVLHDGKGDPSRGDKLKIHFQANSNCYVYVVGVDATGYVSQIFPDPDESLGNPVSAGVAYLMPSGNDWWGLDEQRGIEQIFFVASRGRRADIESAVASLAGVPRTLAVDIFQPVTEPAIVPPVRGLVKVAGTPVTINMGAQSAQFTPTSFVATLQGADVAVTRWLRHQ